jgi:hypothetical protein
MLHRLLRFARLARSGPGPYLPTLAILGLLGCRSTGAGEVVPAGAQPVPASQVSNWVGQTTPKGYTLYRFKWLFRDERSSAGGSGSARLAAPDSLRFDVRGPLGAGAAAAMVVGDTAIWTEPQDIISRLVPNYPLMWALFGVARLPDEGSDLRGLVDGKVTAWQYVRGGDTLSYARTSGSPDRLVTEVRQHGQLLGRAETTLSPEGRPLTARLIVPSPPARLDITFASSTDTTGFPPRVWRRPEARQ